MVVSCPKSKRGNAKGMEAPWRTPSRNPLGAADTSAMRGEGLVAK